MKILAFTPTHGRLRKFPQTYKQARGKAGIWFDWAVFAGSVQPDYAEYLQSLVAPEGLQHLTIWPENRGQHHAWTEALELARKGEYDFILRIDDDIEFKTERWLKKMVERLYDLKKRGEDKTLRFVAVPKILRLKNPIPAMGVIEKDQPYPAEVLEVTGGGVRLVPLHLLDGYAPDTKLPLRRGEPQDLHTWLVDKAMFLRFPDIRVIHDTAVNEADQTPEEALVHRMGVYWPYLGAA